jgi:hypothetical protein
MPVYPYRCPRCGAIDEVRHGSKDAIFVACGECFAVAERYFAPEYLPEFTEDRVRFKNLRHTLGPGQLPDDRKTLRAVEREKGIEFIGKREMPEDWKKFLDYGRHVKQGGERLDPEKVNPRQTAVEPGTIMSKVRKKGIRFGS